MEAATKTRARTDWPRKRALTCSSTRPIPCDWYPWGKEAFETARASGKPVLLSIGYSACHWCHVMAHESFEDPATAALMNELFVNIKVDREERPDIDKIYQFAHQVLTQRGGGWPLTMFLTHDDQKPFFGGTYFPDKARYGMPAFSTLLKRVAEYYREQRDELRAQNDTLMDVFGDLTPAPIDAGDAAHGGAARRRARAARTPPSTSATAASATRRNFRIPASIDRLMHHWHSTAVDAGAGSARAVHGHAHAHAHGRGRHVRPAGRRLRALLGRPVLDDSALREDAVRQRRAARDAMPKRRWPPAMRCSSASRAKPASGCCARCRSLARRTGGGFYSAYDADSEGHEGKFYVWTRSEARAALTPLEWSVFSRRFGFDEEPNFEGAWHAHVFVSIEQIAKEQQLEPAEVEKHIDSARAKLLAIRSKRVWPGLDDKVLTQLERARDSRPRHRRARRSTSPNSPRPPNARSNSCARNLWRTGPDGGGRLLATAKDGVAHLNAYLDDYAYLANALLEMLQLRWRNEDAAWLREILDAMLAHFEDSQARRILLHLGRSRGADPSQQELQ